jgi:putative chitinase
MIVTRDQIVRCWPGLGKFPERVEAYEPHLGAALEEFEIDKPNRAADWFAQMGHESVDCTALVENMNYSAKRLLQVFPKYFKSYAAAAAVAHKPREIANIVYGSRMGNRPGTDDGYNLRGSGLTHLTGRANFEEAGRHFGVDFASNPELTRSPEYMFRIAGWFWKTRNLNDLSDAGKYESLTRRINGGLNGHSDRVLRRTRCRKVFGL